MSEKQEKSFLYQALCDESGKPSSPRIQAMILTVVGSFLAIVGMVLVANGYKGISGYIGPALIAILGKGAANLWGAQLKSAKIQSAQAVVGPGEHSNPVTTTTNKPKQTEKGKSSTPKEKGADDDDLHGKGGDV